MLKKVFIVFAGIMVILVAVLITRNDNVPFHISSDDVKSIHCNYFLEETEELPVSASDQQIIISEISKMKVTKTSGSVGTLPYQFVIELKDGKKITFVQNTKGVIELYSEGDKVQTKVKAPKTAEFIKRFLKENKIEL